MKQSSSHRGGAPVGHLNDLGALEVATVVYLRLWSDGPRSRSAMYADFSERLGETRSAEAINAFEQMCGLCARHGRRPLIRHSVSCKCLGSDESCFANFIAAAAEGAHEDAMLIATLLVRPDVAPLMTSLATDFGLALKRMQLAAPRDRSAPHPISSTLH